MRLHLHDCSYLTLDPIAQFLLAKQRKPPMAFTTPQLRYKAVTYPNNSTPMAIHEQVLDLVKQADGTFGVGSKKILVKVHSAALNPVDLFLYKSAYSVTGFFNDHQGTGRDYSGTVAAIGSEAASKTGLKEGDSVCGFAVHIFGTGSLSEYILLDSSATPDAGITKIPSTVNWDEAAAWPLVYATANQMFKFIGKVDPKAKILVLGGATSVGRLIVEIGRNKYNFKEIVTTNSPRSNEIVTELGSNTIIDYTKQKSLLNPVLESVGKTGQFDYVFDCCGTSDLWPSIDVVLKKGGHYISIVGDKKTAYLSSHAMGVIFKNLFTGLRLVRSRLGLLPYNYSLLLHDILGSKIDEGAKDIETGNFRVTVDSVHEFQDFQKAFDVLGSNKAQGKVVVRVS